MPREQLVQQLVAQLFPSIPAQRPLSAFDYKVVANWADGHGLPEEVRPHGKEEWLDGCVWPWLRMLKLLEPDWLEHQQLVRGFMDREAASQEVSRSVASVRS